MRAPGPEPPPNNKATSGAPRREKGNRRAHGRPQGRPGAGAEGAQRSPQRRAGRPTHAGPHGAAQGRTRDPRDQGRGGQPAPRPALRPPNPSDGGDASRRRRAAQGLPGPQAGDGPKRDAGRKPGGRAASEGGPRLGRPKHLVMPGYRMGRATARSGATEEPRGSAPSQMAAGTEHRKRAPGAVGGTYGPGVRPRPGERAPEEPRRPRLASGGAAARAGERTPNGRAPPGNGAAPARRARCSARSVRRRVRRRAPRQRRRASASERSPAAADESECKRASLYT